MRIGGHGRGDCEIDQRWSFSSGCADARKVTSGLFVLVLLFGQESGKCDDVDVDLLRSNWGLISGHDCGRR